MPTTRFLVSGSLWAEIRDRIRRGRRAQAAIAYVATGAAELLALKRGDTLVVDMSLATVKQGATDPREIRTLIAHGVKVFTRSALHAKVIVIDGAVIASSANASKHSRDVLNEAGIVTTDDVTVRRAREFVERLSVEPVRKEYLKQCIKAYRPPRVPGGGGRRGAGMPRVQPARLWFLGGLRYRDFSEAELRRLRGAERQAARKLKRPDLSEVTWVRYPRQPRVFGSIRVGDWVLECIGHRGPEEVLAPEQVLGKETYVDGRGRRRYVLMLERAKGAEALSLTEFRRRVRRIAPELDKPSPRTRGIRDDDRADAVLGLWTPRGKVARRRRR